MRSRGIVAVVLLTNPHRWPGLRVVDGPDVDGCGVGFVVALDVNNAVRLGARPADVPVRCDPAGLRPRLPWWRDRADLLHEHDDDDDSDDDDGAGVEGVAHWIAATDDGWAGSIDGLAGGVVLAAGSWRVALVDDVGAVPSVTVGDGGLVGRPIGFNTEGGMQWLSLAAPGFYVERAKNPARWLRRRRESGVALDDLRRSKLLAGVVDPERAKAIAVAADGRVPHIDLSYDGDVSAGDVVKNGWSALEHFSRLIGEPLTWERDRPRMQARFDAAPAATVDDVAALARALDPIGWQREQQLREECAMAVALHGVDGTPR